MTYYQHSLHHEDGYGRVHVVFLVSDTFSGLGSTTGATEVGVFDIKSYKTDFEISEGVQVEDELELEMNQAACETQDDRDAIDFVLVAQDEYDTSKRRYCALYIHANTDPSAFTSDDLIFSGILRSDMKAQDLAWHDAEWGVAPDPLRKWSCKAQHFVSAIMDSVPLEYLIYGHGQVGDADYSPGLIQFEGSTGFLDDESGYYRRFSAVNNLWFQGSWADIVGLDQVLNGLRDNLVTALAARGYGNFSIAIGTTELDFKLSPARFNCIAGELGTTSGYLDRSVPYRMLDDEATSIDIGAQTDIRQLKIDYKMVRHDFAVSLPGQAKEYSFLRYKTFTELIYAIALSLGMFVELRFTGQTSLSITFIPRRGVSKYQVYVRDAASADVDTKPQSSSDKKRFVGFSYYNASEGDARMFGANYYWGGDPIRCSPLTLERQRDRDTERLLFSIAPTLIYAESTAANHPVFVLPHNMVQETSSSSSGPWSGRPISRCITTALYISASGKADEGLPGELGVRPAACVHAKINGVDQIYYNLGDYINALMERDKQYFEKEYSLDVPYLCSYRKSADGTHADDDGGRGRFHNLVLGSTVKIDTVSYTVVGIEYDIAGWRTKLRLHTADRFTFSEATGLTDPIDVDAADQSSGATPLRKTPSTNVVIAGEDIAAGDYVAILDDGKAYVAQAHEDHFGRLVGVATTSAVAGGFVAYQVSGIAVCYSWAFTPGRSVYVRGLVSPNLSQTPLDAKNGDESLFARVGVAVSSVELKLDEQLEFLYP